MSSVFKSFILLFLTLSAATTAWSAHTAGLVIHVNPEAHLDVSSIPVSFTVAHPGEEARSTPVVVTAWVRSLPDQTIDVTGEFDGLTGPDGHRQAEVIWSGSMTHATGGAVAATCTGGILTESTPHSLISGWNQSGIAACAITFKVSTDASWLPGTYSGHADLKVSAR